MKKRLTAFFLTAAISLGCICFGACADKSKSVEPVKYRTTMQFYDGFKIMQLTDLHFGIETDVAQQLDVIRGYAQKSKPDLIILTGDSFMYATKGMVRSLFSALNEECAKLTAERGRLTKFSFTFGNHDNQGDYPRYFINETALSFATNDGDEIKDNKYAAFIDFENDHLFGLTNFFIDLVDDRAKTTGDADVKYRLHVIDSNSYYFNGTDYDYDVIHPEQLTHAQSVYAAATADKDYIGMAFFHIPLHEYKDAYDQYLLSPETRGQGEFREGVLYGYTNNGAYDKLKAANVVAYFCGHDHINYGDFLYTDKSGDNAIFSYGVKSTNQIYHKKDMIGYKEITLKDGLTREQFLTVQNIKQNFKNVTGEYGNYENS
ncbi:MAG: metallophosphoesterase [Clostridia bacterium]|nr:metallophosphoesterase [Clostridia bacterium]